jgi:hypothetical protein
MNNVGMEGLKLGGCDGGAEQGGPNGTDPMRNNRNVKAGLGKLLSHNVHVVLAAKKPTGELEDGGLHVAAVGIKAFQGQCNLHPFHSGVLRVMLPKGNLGKPSADSRQILTTVRLVPLVYATFKGTNTPHWLLFCLAIPRRNYSLLDRGRETYETDQSAKE